MSSEVKNEDINLKNKPIPSVAKNYTCDPENSNIMVKKEESQPSCSFTSSSFDPLKALNTANICENDESIEVFDDLNAYRKAIHSRKEVQQITYAGVDSPGGIPLEKPKIKKVQERFFPTDQGAVPSKPKKRLRNILNRMEEIEGPLAALKKYRDTNTRVKVYTRNHKEVRGVMIGYVVAFDKHWNLVLRDVDEIFQKKINCKTPIFGDASQFPCVANLTIDDNDEPYDLEKNPLVWKTPFDVLSSSEVKRPIVRKSNRIERDSSRNTRAITGRRVTETSLRGSSSLSRDAKMLSLGKNFCNKMSPDRNDKGSSSERYSGHESDQSKNRNERSQRRRYDEYHHEREERTRYEERRYRRDGRNRYGDRHDDRDERRRNRDRSRKRDERMRDYEEYDERRRNEERDERRRNEERDERRRINEKRYESDERRRNEERDERRRINEKRYESDERRRNEERDEERRINERRRTGGVRQRKADHNKLERPRAKSWEKESFRSDRNIDERDHRNRIESDQYKTHDYRQPKKNGNEEIRRIEKENNSNEVEGTENIRTKELSGRTRTRTRTRRRTKFEFRQRHVKQLLVRGENVVLVNAMEP